LSKAMTNFGDVVHASERTWNTYGIHFKEVDQSLERGVVAMADGFANYKNQLEAFTTRLEENLARSLNLLSGTIRELSEVVEELQPTFARTLTGISKEAN